MQWKTVKARVTDWAGDFTSNTSIHGVPLTTASITIYGRLVWTMLVCAGAGFLIYQVRDRVNRYLSWPVTVDISVTVADSLTFPAITVCNTNAFKISKADELGYYDILRQFYTFEEADENSTLLNSTVGITAEISASARDVFLQLTHTKTDFIKECSFLSQKCSADNFTVTMTDFGVCYTFNGLDLTTNNAKYLETSLTGAQYGLNLLLNTESYESMAGPHRSAGVKVLAHDQKDIPRIQDVGLSIPPAMSALVGLTLQQSTSLEPPYGSCRLNDVNATGRPYSKTYCEINCHASIVNRTCSCLASYMEPGNISYCQLDKEEVCAKENIMSEKITNGHCENVKTCPYNCDELTYTARVTYEAMSDFEVIKKAIEYSMDTTMLTKFRDSQVLRHQMLKNLHNQEKALVEQSAQVLVELRASTQNASGAQAGLTSILEDWRTYMYGTVRDDCVRILRNISESSEIVRQKFETTYNLTDMATFLRNYLFAINYAISTLMHETKWETMTTATLVDTDVNRGFCSLYEAELEFGHLATVFLLPKVETAMTTDVTAAAAVVNPTYEEQVWINHLQKRGVPIRNLITATKTKLTTVNTAKNTFCTYVRYRTTYYPRSGFPGTAAMQGYRNSLRTALEAVKLDMWNLVVYVQNADDDLRGYYADVSDIGNFLEQNIHSVGIRLDKSIVSVNHFTEYLNIVQPIFDKYVAEFQDPKTKPPSKLAILESLSTAMNQTNTTSADFLEQLDTLYKDISSDANQLIQSMKLMHDSVLGTIANIEAKRGTVEAFAIVRDYMAMSNNLQFQLTEVLNRMVQTAEAFKESSSILYKRLITFNESLVVSEDFIKSNFIRMGIYFETLTYETVLREAAYGWFSLLCDCGGTAGLYLGMSFCSILEFFYFLGKHIILYIQKRRKANKISESQTNICETEMDKAQTVVPETQNGDTRKSSVDQNGVNFAFDQKLEDQQQIIDQPFQYGMFGQ